MLFQLVFSTYLPIGLLKFRAQTFLGCIIRFIIQGVAMLHAFNGPCYTKNEKYVKIVIAITFFHVFLIFRVVRSIESI